MNGHDVLGLDDIVGIKQFSLSGMPGNMHCPVTFMHYLGSLAHQRVYYPVNRDFHSPVVREDANKTVSQVPKSLADVALAQSEIALP